MIISKAPLRVSFFGGGSDIPAHFTSTGASGSTLSVAIEQSVHVAVMPTIKHHVKVSYSQQEDVDSFEDVKHGIVREALRFFGIRDRIEITSFSDIPTIGSGLGGSSAFTCALIVALNRFVGNNDTLTEFEIAKLAIEIEVTMLKSSIGYQDIYASSFGGFNLIDYYGDTIDVRKVDAGKYFFDNFILFPTGMTHDAGQVLDSIDYKARKYALNDSGALARYIYNQKVYQSPKKFGNFLKEAWEVKKEHSPAISNEKIDSIIEDAMKSGANGCKLLGAGGGGYVLISTENKLKTLIALSYKFPVAASHVINVVPQYQGARIVYAD